MHDFCICAYISGARKGTRISKTSVSLPSVKPETFKIEYDVHIRQFSQNRDAYLSAGLHLRNHSDNRFIRVCKKLFAGAMISRMWVRAEL